MKLKHKALTAAFALAFGAGAASAAPITNYLQAGDNVIEDDSNEYIFRPDPASPIGYTLETSGDIDVGDVLVQILDFPIINGTNIDTNGDELTGIAVNTVVSVTPDGFDDPDGPGPNPGYSKADIVFSSPSAADWLALTGIDTSTLGFDATGLVSLLYYDNANNLDVYADAFNFGGVGAGSITDATDGAMAFALTDTGASDFIFANDVPLDIGVFAPSAGETPGVTIYGQFFYGLTVAAEGIPGDVPGTFTGSGNNLVTDRLNIAAVIDDTQASFTYVPEPASLALMGLGMIGAGAMRRRKRA